MSTVFPVSTNRLLDPRCRFYCGVLRQKEPRSGKCNSAEMLAHTTRKHKRTSHPSLASSYTFRLQSWHSIVHTHHSYTTTLQTITTSFGTRPWARHLALALAGLALAAASQGKLSKCNAMRKMHQPITTVAGRNATGSMVVGEGSVDLYDQVTGERYDLEHGHLRTEIMLDIKLNSNGGLKLGRSSS